MPTTDFSTSCRRARIVQALAMLGLAAACGRPSLIAQVVTSAVEPPVPGVSFQLEVALPSRDGVSEEELPMTDSAEVPAKASPEELLLRDVEQQVLSQHPTVREAIAERDAARGRWLQVGLNPNVSAGYSASEIGNDGRAGQEGAYLGQTFVRGGKLQLNRAIASYEIVMRQQDIVAAQQLVLTDARLAFYDLLVLQSRAEILLKLVDLTRQAEATAKQLFDARESPKTDYLQARIELNRIQLDVQTTQVALRRAQQVLATRMALNQLPAARVGGDIEHEVSGMDWQEVRDQVLATHPAVLTAMADVDRARAAVARAQAEVVPDLESQGTVQYDYATRYTVVGLQAVVSVPLWNRNQGGISAAWAEVRAAQQRVDQVRFDLEAKLAQYMSEYQAAEQKVTAYRREILPLAAETQRLIAQAYRQGEVGFLSYLTAQRTFFEANLGYLDALTAYWSGRSRVYGMLPPTPGVRSAGLG